MLNISNKPSVRFLVHVLQQNQTPHTVVNSKVVFCKSCCVWTFHYDIKRSSKKKVTNGHSWYSWNIFSYL